jgi:putative salt-induced outer membrane protein YdiY
MRSILSLAVICALGTTVLADEVVFNNGDRLTGTIRTTREGKIFIDATSAGEVPLDLGKVRSIRTESTVPVRFADGTAVRGPLTVEGGAVTVAGTRRPVTDLKSINAPEVGWTGSVTVSGTMTRGNSVTESVGVNATAVRRTEVDRITTSGEYYFARQKDPDTNDRTTSADAWEVLGKYDYYVNPNLYLFGQVMVEKDRIADLILRVTPSVGVGYEWIDRPDLHFNTEAGLTWVYEDYEGADPDNHLAVRLAYHVDKNINDKVKLFHNLEFLPNVEDLADFNVSADAGLRVTLTQRLYSEAKADWKHDQTPAPGSHRNDVRLLVGLGYEF